MGFGLVIGLTEHLLIVTTSNYSAIANSHTLQFTKVCTKSSQSAMSSPVGVPLLPGSRPRRLAAISHQHSTLTAVSRLPCNGIWLSLYSLGTDRTENTASNSYSTVALHSRYLAMAVSLAPQFLLWANMPQYLRLERVSNPWSKCPSSSTSTPHSNTYYWNTFYRSRNRYGSFANALFAFSVFNYVFLATFCF
jgi:hypothetical protein